MVENPREVISSLMLS